MTSHVSLQSAASQILATVENKPSNTPQAASALQIGKLGAHSVHPQPQADAVTSFQLPFPLMVAMEAGSFAWTYTNEYLRLAFGLYIGSYALGLVNLAQGTGSSLATQLYTKLPTTTAEIAEVISKSAADGSSAYTNFYTQTIENIGPHLLTLALSIAATQTIWNWLKGSNISNKIGTVPSATQTIQHGQLKIKELQLEFLLRLEEDKLRLEGIIKSIEKLASFETLEEKQAYVDTVQDLLCKSVLEQLRFLPKDKLLERLDHAKTQVLPVVIKEIENLKTQIGITPEAA